MTPVVCPLCGTRRSKRACPALGQQICPVCCGTKRLVEIRCPSDCPYLASAREHPAAVVVRQHQHDVEIMLQLVRDFSDRQSHLLLLLATFLSSGAGAIPPDGSLSTARLSLTDDDVMEAVGALASTYETAARGVIYEHRPTSLVAQRLVGALKSVLAQVGEGSGTSFDRDAAVVLRRLAQAIAEQRGREPGNRRAFLDLAGRVFTKAATGGIPGEAETPEPPRLIVP